MLEGIINRIVSIPRFSFRDVPWRNCAWEGGSASLTGVMRFNLRESWKDTRGGIPGCRNIRGTGGTGEGKVG